mgnify:CR=1 FL=1
MIPRANPPAPPALPDGTRFCAAPVTRASPRAPFGRIGRFLENDARQGSGHGEVDDQSAVLALDDREAPRLELVELDEGDIAKR